MDRNMDKQLVIKALLMAVYQRQPKSEVRCIAIKIANTAVLIS
nr:MULTISPECIES: hypothetical protein [unclassified Pseudoalteromonas]